MTYIIQGLYSVLILQSLGVCQFPIHQIGDYLEQYILPGDVILFLQAQHGLRETGVQGVLRLHLRERHVRQPRHDVVTSRFKLGDHLGLFEVLNRLGPSHRAQGYDKPLLLAFGQDGRSESEDVGSGDVSVVRDSRYGPSRKLDALLNKLVDEFVPVEFRDRGRDGIVLREPPVQRRRED